MATRLSKIPGGGAVNPARVPPHNLEAEESVLGACLLSRQAIATALEQLSPEDFYKPAHTEMFRTMLELYARGEPIDAVTLGEELRRQGKLEEYGGKPYLFTLVSAVPSPGSVGHYAKIVVENATLRRLIDASQEIGDLAYALPDDVEEAVDQAEDLIYQVTNRRTSEELAHLKDLLTENMEMVEKLYERGSAITGVATGFTDLDELTAGLQPSNLIIVAARPSMGKALALDTPIATPTGWVTMGELAPGDDVFDERGRPCRVEATSPVYTDHPCYQVVFDDGSVIVADAGHQWVAWDETAEHVAPLVPGGTPWARVITTGELAAATPAEPAGHDARWSIRLADPLDLPEAPLTTDPYALGAWLGDQYAGNPDTTLRARDRAHFSDQFEDAGYCLGLHAQQGCFVLGTSPVRATGAWQGTDGPGRALAHELEDLGLGRASVRGLPEDYLWGSFKQRLALLQGLLDAAAAPDDLGRGTVTLWLTSRDLMSQVRDLACSLGHCPGPIQATTGGHALTWAPLDPPFRMARKADILGPLQPADGTEVRRRIVAVRPVPPVPVRCIQVDSPSHLYLAGDSLIPTHNSALALSMAQHVAATDHVPVVIFSLEMSKMELVQRLMCSEARVDSNRLRKGALQDSDWPKLSLALGRLAEAPIFIDDTPNITIMEMRAKCRRVKSKQGLGLVIIDYLQLMAPLKRTDNRVQEVSEISRSLKILARELDVPVIALSQLSRNVEYRADKRPLLADLRESGCVTGGTRILRADTGAEQSFADLLASGDHPLVWALDENLQLVPRPVTDVFPSGVKEVFRVELATGRSVEATTNHPFLTLDGWLPLGELPVGTRVGTPRSLPDPLQTHALPEPALARLARQLRRRNVAAVPAPVWSLPRGQLAVFLRHLWRGGGCDWWHHNRRVAEDVARLLLRFGVLGTVRPGVAQGGWCVSIPDAAQRTRLMAQIDAPGPRPAPCPPAAERFDTREPAPEFSAPARERLRWAALALREAPTAALATGDVSWDEIVAITPLGRQPVFDATVAGCHNFIADGINLHNSIEQDADVVMFIYRDEVYNPESTQRGIAELHISKHRSGPIGKVELTFLSHYTKFANLARGM